MFSMITNIYNKKTKGPTQSFIYLLVYLFNVSYLLNDDSEVICFVNPCAVMKFLKDTSRAKLQHMAKM